MLQLLFAAVSESQEFDWRAFLAPFHAVTLHMPIGFVTIALILEIFALGKTDAPNLRRGIGLILVVSAFSAVLVAWLGILRAGGGGYEDQALTFHRWTGISVAAVTFLLPFIHRIAFNPRGIGNSRIAAFVYRVLLLANVGLLTVAGHYGGNLTHGSRYLTENAPEWVKDWLAENVSPSPSPDGGGQGVFAEKIRPVLEKKCFQCHGAEKQKGDYQMDTVEGMFAAGESELDPIVSGRPLESYLVEVITLPPEDDFFMPPEGKEALTPEETLAVIRWIWDGAEAPGKPEAGQ